MFTDTKQERPVRSYLHLKQSMAHREQVRIVNAEQLPGVFDCIFPSLVGKRYPAIWSLGRTRAFALTHELFQVKILDRPKLSQIDAVLPAGITSNRYSVVCSIGHLKYHFVQLYYARSAIKTCRAKNKLVIGGHTMLNPGPLHNPHTCTP